MAPRRHRDVTLEELFALAAEHAAGGMEENPSEASLDEALRKLGYEPDERQYIEKHYTAIYEAFANRVGALDFADGVRGKTTGAVDPDLEHDVKAAIRDALLLGSLGNLGVIADLDVTGGKLVVVKGGKERTYKLGKLLQKAGATSSLLHRFELRQVALDWVIAADPMEVAAMSYGRGWVSCMRPGERHERGPLSDVLAGSALLLFYRPGAHQPCGREVLRPSAKSWGGVPQIVRPGVTYGTATHVPSKEIADAIREQTGVVVEVATRDLRKEDGPYLDVYDDYSSQAVSITKQNVPKVTEALRRTWARFVDLPTPSVEGLGEPIWEDDPSLMYDQARQVAHDVIRMWGTDGEEADPIPDKYDLPIALDEEHGFNEEISKDAWRDEIKASQHRVALIVSANEFNIKKLSGMVGDALVGTEVSRDYWRPNYRELYDAWSAAVRKLDDDAQFLIVTAPNLDTLYTWNNSGRLSKNAGVLYWVVVGIR